MDEIGELRARLAALDMQAEMARADVAGWRPVGSSATFFRPLPLVAQADPSCDGTWIGPDEWTPLPARLALDGRQRPVALALDWFPDSARTRLVWHYGEGWLEQLDARGEVLRATLDGDRVIRVVAVSAEMARIEEVTWEDGVAVRATGVRRRFDGGEEERFVRTATVGADGRVEQVRVDGELVWDGRISRAEPWPDDPDGLIEPLARALDRALRAAALASGIAEPFCLEVRPGGYGPQWPPFARLGSRAFRDRMRRSSRTDAGALEHLYRGEDSGDVALLSLVDELDAGALRACRALSTALTASFNPQAMAVADAVGDRLAELLCATPPEGAADPFLALVYTGDSELSAGLDRARRAAGDARVDAFLATVRSRSPRPAAPQPNALTDRAALERLLAERGLEAHARKLAHEVARDGLLLVPGDGPSHLGGPPLLPPDTAWPAVDGLPLTFLAAIRLDDTPLAHGGWLLFYAGLDPDADVLVEDEPNAPGAAARVLHALDPVAADGPALRPRPLTLRRVLTLPDGHDAAGGLGLDVYDGQAYEEVVETLAELRRAETGTMDEHWFGGLATGAQGFTPEPGSTLLLHISYDAGLGFEFADGGVIQFRIPADALARGDWSRIVAYPDSY